MEETKDKILAYVVYEGDLVKDGYLDAKKAGQTLIGLDELVRYFLYQEFPQIKNIEFEIPVRVKKGSWWTQIPDNIDIILAKTVAAWAIGKYAGSALGEIAKNDFKDVSFRKIFSKAFHSIVSVIRLAKHLGTLTKRKFDKVKFSDNNQLVGIENDNGEIIWLEPEILELYSNCPETIFTKIAQLVEEERELIIGVSDEKPDEEKITFNYKPIFVRAKEEDEILFPDLKHNDYVEITGHTTRGNEKSNTIGFLYEGHILTCYPDTGNIKEHKSALFANCLLKGFVDRLDKDGNFNEKRPRIKYIQITITGKEDNQTKLFTY